jgi:hypothetical protein
MIPVCPDYQAELFLVSENQDNQIEKQGNSF